MTWTCCLGYCNVLVIWGIPRSLCRARAVDKVHISALLTACISPPGDEDSTFTSLVSGHFRNNTFLFGGHGSKSSNKIHGERQHRVAFSFHCSVQFCFTLYEKIRFISSIPRTTTLRLWNLTRKPVLLYIILSHFLKNFSIAKFVSNTEWTRI